MVEKDIIEFNGIKFRRYPNSKIHVRRTRYSPHSFHRKRGVESLHREIWKFYNGPIPAGYHIHHIDGDPLNNAIENLECLSEEEHRAKHSGVKICAHCGKHFDTKSMGTAIYCSAACTTLARYHSGIDHESRTCIGCGTAFRCHKHSKTKYCSESCASKSQWKRQHAARLSEQGVQKVCAFCGIEFIDNTYEEKAIYCSTSCIDKARYWSGVDHETRVCVKCGKEYRTHKHSRSTHCSKSCTISENNQNRSRG